MSELIVRTVTVADWAFLEAMLYEAAYWRAGDRRPTIEEALAPPEIRLYLHRWGRAGDRGLIATAGGEPLGVGWYRLFCENERGYGFVDPNTPELTLAVAPAHRGKGVGTTLLAALLLQARLDGFAALSLSVERDNPARHLYQQLGFEPVAEVGNAHTMVASCSRARPHRSG
jgi:ribosomal protein S18 acetylase RimI-like enzyme